MRRTNCTLFCVYSVAAVILLFGIFVNFAEAQPVQTVMLWTGEVCEAIPENSCTQCGSKSYYMFYANINVPFLGVYASTDCTGDPIDSIMVNYDAPCQSSQQSCIFTYYQSSGNVYTGEFTTTTSIRVGSLTGPNDFLRMNISSQAASVIGYLDHVKIETENSHFRFHQIKNNQTFECNFGVLNFEQSYTFDDMTFTIFLNVDYLHFSELPEYTVSFAIYAPINLKVTNDLQYQAFFDYYRLNIETNISNSLDGIVVGVMDWFELHNISAYPPYNSNDAYIVYQVSQRDAYILQTKDCFAPEDNSVQCDFSREELIVLTIAAGNFPSSLPFSISLDRIDLEGERQQQNVDELSFSLF